MPIQTKKLDQKSDVKTQLFPSLNSLITATGQSQATTNNIILYTMGPFSGTYVNKPDSLGSSTAGISPSGAINSATKKFFNRWDPNLYYNSASGVYTLPAAHSGNINVVAAKVIEVTQPTRSHGIWPDSFTGVFTYNSVSITAVDSSRDSFGTNKESLVFGKLTDINNPSHVVGSIFYDDGTILLHGGTGAASAFYQASVTGFAFRGSITGALTASTSASHVICETMSLKTYQVLARNIYVCHLKCDEFNYTSNPSAQNVDFLQREENATTYITSIGLMDARGNLLAVGKCSPPQRKNAFIPLTFKVVISI